MVFSTGNIFAQNEMKARIEYEDAELAFQNQEYEKAITHLTEAEKLLGKWTAKVSFLKIQALDIVTDYGAWSENTAEIYRQVKEYMKYADKNPDKVDLDKMRELYEVEKRADGAKKTKDWKEISDYKNGLVAYENKNYQEALTLWKKAADKGNGSAMRMIGKLYGLGVGVEQSWETALQWYQKGETAGDGECFGLIAHRYFNGQGVTKDYTEGTKWLKKAVNTGIASIISDMARLQYEHSRSDRRELVKYYKQAIDKGETYAMVYLALLYSQNGSNVDATNLYKKAADGGNSWAMTNLATHYREGAGVPQNYQEAMKWYIKSAELRGENSNNAMIGVASLYKKGLGVTVDYNKAIEWYEKGLELRPSNSETMFEIGECYYQLKDYNKAIEWYKKSADKEHTIAMNNLGNSYYNIQNYTEALSWYPKAYENGKTELKIEVKEKIATMYEQGLGVEKDKKMAKEWRSK